ncbi:hypothetical protein ACET3Z_031572 [Daucus carota]
MWVVKEKPADPEVSSPGSVSKEIPSASINPAQVKPSSDNLEAPWTEVKRKGRSCSSDEESPSPLQTFKNLKRIDEVVQKTQGPLLPKLSKHQLKKLKKSAGKGSPPSANL